MENNYIEFSSFRRAFIDSLKWFLLPAMSMGFPLLFSSNSGFVFVFSRTIIAIFIILAIVVIERSIKIVLYSDFIDISKLGFLYKKRIKCNDIISIKVIVSGYYKSQPYFCIFYNENGRQKKTTYGHYLNLAQIEDIREHLTKKGIKVEQG